MATVVDQLVVDVRANTAQAVAGLGAVTTKVGGLQAAAAGLSAVGAGLTKGLTLPILGLGAVGVKAFSDFDSAMTQSLAIMSDESQGFRKQMEETARTVAKTTTISAEQAAEAYFFLASAGMDAEQSMAALPQVAKFAQAGMFDMATATDLATDAQSALGLVVDDAQDNLGNLTRVTDVFVRANTLANATVEQFSSAMTNKAGAALRAVGKDMEEGTAVLAAFADQGLKGEAAGTALHIVMRDMQTAASKNAEAFKEANVAVYDANGEMRNMADITADLEGALDGMSDKQRKATLAQLGFTDKSMGFINTLLGSSDAIREYEGELRNASGFTDKVAGKQLESFSAQWQLLKNKFMDIALTIGSVLVPKLAALIDKVSPYIDMAAEWIEQNSELALKIGGVAAAIGPLLFTVGKFIKIIGLISSPIGLAVAAIAGIVWVLDQMGVTFEDVIAFVQPVIDIFNALAGYFRGVVEDGDYLNDFLTHLPEPLQPIVEAVGEFIANIDEHWQNLVDFTVAAWEAIWEFLEPIVEHIIGFIVEQVQSFADWWGEIWPDIQKVIEIVLGLIQRAWERVWPILQKYVLPIVKAITKIIGGAFNIIKGIFQTILAIITGNWSGAWEGIKKVVSGAWDIIVGVVEGGWNLIKAAFEGAIAILKTAWDVLWSFLGNAVKAGWDFIVGLVEKGANGVLGLLSKFANGFIDMVNGLITAANLIPGVSFDKLKHINMSVKLAHGGDLMKGGMVTLGENGPESVYLPAGASVRPNSAGGGGGNGQLLGDVYIDGDADAGAIARELAWRLTLAGGAF